MSDIGDAIHHRHWLVRHARAHRDLPDLELRAADGSTYDACSSPGEPATALRVDVLAEELWALDTHPAVRPLRRAR